MRFKVWVLDPRQSTVITNADGTEQIRVHTDAVILTTVLADDEIFEPEPWVRHGIERKGWRVIQKELPASGLNDHGSVDWKTVAETLAKALDAVVEQEDLSDAEPAENASRALDDFRIAQTEAALAEGPDVVVYDEDTD